MAMLRNRGELGLVYIEEEKETWVSLKKCFPKTHSEEFISVLNNEGEEILFIEAIDKLEEKDRQAVKEYLEKSNYQMEIIKIIFVQDEYGFRHWEVETTSGKRVFQTALSSWPIVFGNGSILIEDLNKDRYWISNRLNLDTKSDRILSTYVD